MGGVLDQKFSGREGPLDMAKVVVHVGEKSTTMFLATWTVGYTTQQGLHKVTEIDTFNPKINIAKLVVTKLGNEYFQLLTDSNGAFHLYLPSVVDGDNKDVWK